MCRASPAVRGHDRSRTPITAPFAQLSLPLERPAPNEAIVSGVFRNVHVAAGAQLLTVRRLGVAPLDKPLSRPTGAVTNFRLVRSTVRTIVGVTTTATMAWTMAWMKDFDEHCKLGLGQFFTRDQLAKRSRCRTSTSS